MPITTDSDGSSTVITGSGRGSSGSASVSPIVTSGSPATAMISPGPASSASTRSSASVTYSSVISARSTVPSARHHAIGPLRTLPWRTRQSASRPTYGEASRFVTCAWSGWAGSCSGAGMRSSSRSISGFEVGALDALLERGPARLGVGVDDRELDLLLVGVEVEEQLVDLVDHLGDARVGPVDLVHHEDHRQPGLQRLAQHEAGLGQRALGGVDQQQHAVDHRQPALHLAAEVRVAGRVDDVELRVAVPDGRVLGEDRDALLALQVGGVHHPVGHVLVLAEGARLPQHRVHERGLAVIDVGHDGHVAQVFSAGHGGSATLAGGAGLSWTAWPFQPIRPPRSRAAPRSGCARRAPATPSSCSPSRSTRSSTTR